MTFYQYFHEINKAEIQDRMQSCTPQIVESILKKAEWTVHDFPELISDAASYFLEEMGEQSRRLTLQRFGTQVELYAPLYVSNYCVNSCKYCGFNVRNKIPRHTLTLQQALKEADLIHREGIGNLLLVSGENRSEVPVQFFESLASELTKTFDKLSIEIYPLEEKEYSQLLHAGINGLTLYQETYNKALYSRFHRGPKADFIGRLETHERAARAGFPQLGIGALLGLADPQIELWSVATHAHFLLETFRDIKVSVSFPRIREAEGQFKPDVPVTDSRLVQAIYALRMVLPELDLVLSTREEQAFRDELMGMGITRMSAGSKTNPGGYAQAESQNPETDLTSASGGPSSLEQFKISDRRSAAELCEALSKKGLKPVSFLL